MLLSITATATYDLPCETFLLLMVEPALRGAAHAVREERLVTTPMAYAGLANDGFGNPQRRLVAPAGRFSYEFAATVEAEPGRPLPPGAAEVSLRDAPPDALAYTLPSRYCQSDLLARMARGEFGALPPGGGRVQAVADWVRRNVEYRSGSTDSKTSAFDTATERSGVCRDFAHLLIAFCRALGVPARYASGYALGLEPEDFHGYAQVYLAGGWHDVDATVEGARPALVPIAVGRDAADVATATFWGEARLLGQGVQVRRAD